MTGDGDRLITVPVATRVGQAGGGRSTLVGGAAAHRYRDVGGRLARQFDGERGGAPRLGCLARHRAGDDTRFVVVGGGDGNGDVAQAVVVVVAGAGRVEDDAVGLRAIVEAVVLTGDGDRLVAVPVAGAAARERHAGGTHRALAGVLAADRHRYVGTRLGVEFDGEGGGAAGLCSLSSDRAGGDAGLVVVGGGDAHFNVAQGVVGGVATGRVEDDVVGHRAVVGEVIDAGDGHRLGVVPVRGRKRQAGRADRALAGVLAAHRYGDVGGRFGRQFDGERGGAARLGGLPRNRTGGEGRRIVVGGAHAHGDVGQTPVIAVAGAVGIQDNVVGLRAIVDVVVNAGDGDGLVGVPVAGGERQAGGVGSTLAGVPAAHRNRYAGGRLGVELDGERGGTPRFRCLATHRTGRQAGTVVVGGGDADVDVVQVVVDAVAVHARTARIQDDVVGYRAVVAGVVDAGDGDGLIIIPVARRERQAGGACRALVGGVTAHRHGDVGGRFARQFDGEGVGAAGLVHLCGTATVDDRQPRRIAVVGGIHAHGDVGQGVVIAVAGAGRVQNDVIAHRSIVDVVVLTGDGDGLGTVPIRGGERQAGGGRPTLAGVVAADRNRDVGGRLGVELDGEARGAARLGRLSRHRAGGDAGRVVVGGARRYFDVG